ncbi:PID-CTERM protein-sorting domain-containing protein [Flammeovirga kamogawensis]|uniref:PEP-CTERM sorting domain-containing protein n=1 Tax=Flammeovirga kamogawensis TaxID=373891 RepID=A0ABX8GUH6_9BACT|nr:hypothetical protein [Flammeovirga kamogawensis]MBB6459680.1 hypothetical protein [Flammeovirga kamogawensis]QWG07258.1 hypothetical protein KM029_18440 [Flammeovirga kamogawensis]TRX69078.1 hypothetical protein EO216_13430 [Flammeovirga kamogawensis]
MNIKFLLSLVTLLFISILFVHAQPPPPPGEGVPIDGGATLLIASGVAYGIKKFRDYTSKND